MRTKEQVMVDLMREEKPVVFVVRLDDLSKLKNLAANAVMSGLKAFYDSYCSEDTTEFTVEKDFVATNSTAYQTPPEGFKMMFATKGKQLNSDNRRLIQVSIA